MLIDCNAGMDTFQFVCDEMGREHATGSAALNLLVEGIAAFVSSFVFRRWLPSQGHRCCTPVSSSEPASSSLTEHGFREGFPRLQVCKELNQRRCGSCELQRGCRSEPRNPVREGNGPLRIPAVVSGLDFQIFQTSDSERCEHQWIISSEAYWQYFNT